MDSVLVAAIVSGLLQGALYGSVALGLSLVFGVMRVVNFAHGSFLMLGMFAAYFTAKLTGLDVYVGLVVGPLLMFVFGYAVQRYLITPLYRRERAFVIEPTSVLILTAGFWLVLDNTALIVLGPSYRTLPSSYSAIVQIGALGVPLPRLLAAVGSGVLAIGLYTLVMKSNIGRAIQAASQNRDAAALAGIDIYRVYAITFGIAAAATGVAGALLLPTFVVYPTVGFSFDIRAFLIVILGGMGSIPGTMAAALIMGVVEAVAAQFVSGTYAQFVFFVVFVVVLTVRPQGIFGRGFIQ
jgi:branched-chain amino acid transport system permease protein